MKDSKNVADSRRSEFQELASQRLGRAWSHARINYYVAYFCYAIAVISSLFATILASMSDGTIPRPLLVITSALPGAALLINSVLALEKKADWHYKRKR